MSMCGVSCTFLSNSNKSLGLKNWRSYPLGPSGEILVAMRPLEWWREWKPKQNVQADFQKVLGSIQISGRGGIKVLESYHRQLLLSWNCIYLAPSGGAHLLIGNGMINHTCYVTISVGRWVVLLLAMRTCLSTNFWGLFALGTFRIENCIVLKDVKIIQMMLLMVLSVLNLEEGQILQVFPMNVNQQ